MGYDIDYPISTDTEESAFIITRDNNINLIITGSSTHRFEMIPRLLTENGPPDQILIHTLASMPDANYLPFMIALFYQEQRILAVDEFPNHKNGNLLIACPLDKDQDSLMGGPWLYLWSPEEIWTPYRVQETILGVEPYKPLRRLEDVTDMTVETFYQIFKNPNSNACVGTPIDLWE